jgi:hypothetical protein
MIGLNGIGVGINKVLGQFQPISLDEMDSVKLMNRFDTKFFFNVNLVENILDRASKHYRILEISTKRQFHYQTTYFDTPDLLLYREHQNGKLNRLKIRQRRYDATGAEFFEVKLRTNKGRTLKSRIVNNNAEYLNANTDVFLKKSTPYSILNLHKVIKNDFIRITLVDYNLSERVTLDFNVSFSNSVGSIEFPTIGIVEVKQSSHSEKSQIVKIMKDLKIRPASISKYCLGVASLFNDVKANNLKSQILKINNYA